MSKFSENLPGERLWKLLNDEFKKMSLQQYENHPYIHQEYVKKREFSGKL